MATTMTVVTGKCSTPFGDFEYGEVVKAPYEIAEWLLHNEFAIVARNWRWCGEKKAPVPVATRTL